MAEAGSRAQVSWMLAWHSCHQTLLPLPLFPCPLCSVCTPWRHMSHTPLTFTGIDVSVQHPSRSSHMGHRESGWLLPMGPGLGQEMGESQQICWAETSKSGSLRLSFYPGVLRAALELGLPELGLGHCGGPHPQSCCYDTWLYKC